MGKNQKIQLWSALFISVVCFYAFLGSYALNDNNEGLYAGISLWMAKTGNYILPRLNGLIYIEKPPMLYWLVALNFNIFGVNEWTARLVPASSGFLLGLILFRFLRHENRKADSVPFLLVWSSCVGVAVFSRMLFFDMLFTLFLGVLLISLYLFKKNREKRTWLYLAYAMAALATLTKGLLGIALPALTMFVFVYCEQAITPWYSPKRLWASIKEMFSYFSVIGMIIFFAVALPWHILAAQQDPEFLYFYFVNEHFLRFLGTRQPEDYYTGPVYYYLVRLFGYMAPWTIFLPAFIWRDKKRVQKQAEPMLERFCWVWFLTVLIFFSISRAKANYYIIAAMPPLVMLFAFRMREAKDFIYSRVAFIILNTVFISGLIVIILAWFVPVLLAHQAPSWVWAAKLHKQIFPLIKYMPHFHIPALIAIIFFISALFVIWYANRKKNIREYYIWTVAVFAALACVLIMSQMYLLENNYSTRNIIADICEKYRKDDIRLYMYNDFEELSTTPYYLGHPAPIINWNSNDLWYGMRKEDSKPYKITLKDFLKLPADRPIFVLMERRRVDDFDRRTAGSGFKVWKDYGKRVIFCKENSRAASSPTPKVPRH